MTAAIVGLGVTQQGRVPGVTSLELRLEGLQLAVEDAGLKMTDIEGYIYQPGIVEMDVFGLGGYVPKLLGTRPRLVWQTQSGGVSAIQALTTAVGLVERGECDYVAVGYGDTALSANTLVGDAGMFAAHRGDTPGVYGMYSPGADHALAARRHMAEFGTTKEQLGAVSLNARAYANMRPDAYMHGRTMTMDDYLGARPIADPLGKFDYCLVADGGCAFIVTTEERAKDCPGPTVLIEGLGFGHSLQDSYEQDAYLTSGITHAAKSAFARAKMSPSDIDVAEIYDCFTITVLMALEGLGFCGRGESGPFVADGNLWLDGVIPTNTAGGELSWSYMQGFTPVVEAIRQVRGDAGPTQVAGAETCVVTGHGGTTTDQGYMEYGDACMILRKG
ncbi:thiolase family protein [Rhodococcus sp. NPDC057014]|uniref:thiolase family protein n=1 Tax=unclassified Rhodococcus (in: high G+C Gram-positive bacteria) TaxID=192944 RepID=UPI0023E1D1F1|nr:thiolase family protein [Rhodococcus sp. T2V]MDF3313279.1 thiolase family protein [Rhodococcus sp. T2V]